MLSIRTHLGTIEKLLSQQSSTTGGGRWVAVALLHVNHDTTSVYSTSCHCVPPLTNYILLCTHILVILHVQVNTVFDHLQVTSQFNGYVFFLEEDHYVSPDFVHVAKKLITLKENQCQDCDFINMGTYQKISMSQTNNQVCSTIGYTQVLNSYTLTHMAIV